MANIWRYYNTCWILCPNVSPNVCITFCWKLGFSSLVASACSKKTINMFDDMLKDNQAFCSFGYQLRSLSIVYLFTHLKAQHLWQLFPKISPTGEVLALNHGLQRATNQMMWSLLRIRRLKELTAPPKSHPQKITSVSHALYIVLAFVFLLSCWTLKRHLYL